MKATKLLIAAVLTLQATILFANNENSPAPAANAYTTTGVMTLSPTTPVEATFEEEIMFDINQLVPVIPTEATFEDASFDMISILNLAPVTPTIANFEDTFDETVDIHALAPVTPDEPDFE